MRDRLICSVIDVVNKRRLDAKLLDDKKEEVDIQDTVKTLHDFMKNKLSMTEAKNHDDQIGEAIRNEILPLVSSMVAVTLEESLGHDMAGFLLSDRVVKTVMIRLGLMGYAFHSLVQQNKFTVKTTSIPVSDDEIGQMLRLEDLSDLITKAVSSGIDAKAAVAELIRRELITLEDLRAFGLDEDLVQALASLVKSDTQETKKEVN